MPELPEVETTRLGIAPHIEGATVTRTIIRYPTLRWPIPKQLKSAIQDQALQRITRRGKYLLFDFASGTLILHLGMSGRLRVLEADCVAEKHDHVDIHFSNQRILRYTDPRRFGALLFTKENPYQHPLIASIGVEPLTDAFNAEYLLSNLKHRKSAIKTCLLDGRIVAGVGNIYATESLFIAGIDPRKAAGKIPEKKLMRLVEAVKMVLTNAIKSGGTTLKDFLQANGKPGYFSLELKAYGNAGDPCPQCKKILISARINGRATVFCKQCQT